MQTPEIWRKHLIRGKVVEFVRGSLVESDRWNAKWSDDGSTLLMKASKVGVAIALEAGQEASTRSSNNSTNRSTNKHNMHALHALHGNMGFTLR